MEIGSDPTDPQASSETLSLAEMQAALVFAVSFLPVCSYSAQ